MTQVYCHECGYQNPEEGKYCSKCGALLHEDDVGAETTIRYSLSAEEREAAEETALEGVGREGVFMVVRSGGGLAGAVFTPSGDETTIGRHQDSDIFMDDITVSRHHAVLVRGEDGYYIRDEGSLNGTYVNRVRVETRKLSDGDQVQIGKYKLTFIER